MFFFIRWGRGFLVIQVPVTDTMEKFVDTTVKLPALISHLAGFVVFSLGNSCEHMTHRPGQRGDYGCTGSCHAICKIALHIFSFVLFINRAKSFLV